MMMPGLEVGWIHAAQEKMPRMIVDQLISGGNGLFMNVRSWYLLFTAKGYTGAVLEEVSPCDIPSFIELSESVTL
jgi:hypothetical protein